MAKNEDAHEALFLFFQRDVVPPKMIVDSLKEQTLGDFKHKVAEAGCHLRQTEPESPWKMAAKGGVYEINRGSVRNMTKMKTPKVIWDYCLELEAYIRSNTAMSISDLDGMNPKTNMSGETSGITTF